MISNFLSRTNKLKNAGENTPFLGIEKREISVRLVDLALTNYVFFGLEKKRA